MTQSNEQASSVLAQAGKVLTQIAGYVGVRTIQIGIQSGLLEEIGRHAAGITAESLARVTGFDHLYVQVWSRAAYASELLEVGADETFTLAPHMSDLLLNRDFPGYIGGIPIVLDSPEVFDGMAERLPTGQRIWWDECSHEFIQAVSGTGRPFYTRLIPNGLSQVPGLTEKLERGASVAELACGAGVGLVRMAHTYTRCTIVGVDGDRYSVETTRQRIADHGIADRVTLQQSTLEN
ncbi:MAG: class I SAM-dependent methyltransferase [Chloroflexi bacterium]|nr:class I SAM-dependent methyltransferase [Chloroflexota bacterium]MDA1297337.1 class I SAM-dependent methyltransferase [Chloroflexota bacterium]